jgi:hypothetical protein
MCIIISTEPTESLVQKLDASPFAHVQANESVISHCNLRDIVGYRIIGGVAVGGLARPVIFFEGAEYSLGSGPKAHSQKTKESKFDMFIISTITSTGCSSPY